MINWNGQCGSCRFVGPSECRRHAPIGIMTGDGYTHRAVWPRIDWGQTCGDWELDPRYAPPSDAPTSNLGPSAPDQ